ncbi:MAG: hypothetical protein KF752_10900 [Pirellulaceae bacterium]|nr:hypothetical protein [Pirellulaceae bacterium]
MGIRFQCHRCGHGLHVKDFQAGKRGRCPQCGGSLQIPSAQDSAEIESTQPAPAPCPKPTLPAEPAGESLPRPLPEQLATAASIQPPASIVPAAVDNSRASTGTWSTGRPIRTRSSTGRRQRNQGLWIIGLSVLFLLLLSALIYVLMTQAN